MCSVCDDFADRFAAGNVDSSYGAVAHLVERFHGMEEVARSIRVGSTPNAAFEGSVSDRSLAGFVAGEGCFTITRKLPAHRNGDPRLRFRFLIEVASRDRDLLERLRTRLELGPRSISDRAAVRESWQPTSRLTVSTRLSHRDAVIPFMREHLLAGAKQRQFELWVQAMDAYDLLHPTRYGRGPSPCRVDGCDRPVRGRGLCRSHYYEETGY